MENTLFAIGKERHFERLPNVYTDHKAYNHLDTLGKVFDYMATNCHDFDSHVPCMEILCKALSEINALKDREWFFPRFVVYWENTLASGSYLCEIIEGVPFDWNIEHFIRTVYRD